MVTEVADPKPKCSSLVAGRLIAAGGCDGGVLFSRRSGDLDLRPDSVAVALNADQFNVIQWLCVGRFIVKHPGRTVIRSHDNIDLAVIVDVADRQSRGRPLLLKHFARLRRNIHKLLSGLIPQQQRRFAISQDEAR